MSNPIYVKYCPICGAENPRQQAFCRQCADGDLSTIPAEVQREMTANVSLPHTAGCVMELVDDPSFNFTVREGQTVGRTHKADVILAGVPNFDWISGAHARFTRRGEQWYVQHIAQTNFIKVDGEMFKGQEEVAIFDGSILVLSLTAFRVRIGGD